MKIDLENLFVDIGVQRVKHYRLLRFKSINQPGVDGIRRISLESLEKISAVLACSHEKDDKIIRLVKLV